MSADFFLKIPGFNHFTELSEDRHYRTIPEDWLVIVADIRGSTQAVRDGRYKDVNLIGAACITTVLNVIDTEIPFVFGGDGASLLIPPQYKAPVFRALKDLIQIALNHFSMVLTVGFVPVVRLKEEGFPIEVARFSLWENRNLALFRGGGLSEAEKRIKQNPDYQITADSTPPDDNLFEGLTCRWNRLPSKHGTTLSLLIMPFEASNSKNMGEIVRSIETILGGDLNAGNPVNIELSHYKTLVECLQQERRFHPGWASPGYMKRVVEIGIAVPLFGWGLHHYFPKANHYYHALKSHADFQKYDDTLRMIIDCTDDQSQMIEQYLLEAEKNQQLIFGLHRSDAAR